MECTKCGSNLHVSEETGLCAICSICLECTHFPKESYEYPCQLCYDTAMSKYEPKQNNNQLN